MKLNLFRAAVFTPLADGRWGLPLLAWSKPGEGKSKIIKSFCQTFGLPFVSLSPGTHGEGAFGAIPVPDRSGVIKYPPPEWTQVVANGGLVFVDELTTCFIAGTLVSMADGTTRPIESIRVGDRVTSFDLKCWRRRGNAVTHRMSHTKAGLVRVETADGKTLDCTNDHPFYTPAGWKLAGSLQPGDVVGSLSGVRSTARVGDCNARGSSRHDAGGGAGGVPGCTDLLGGEASSERGAATATKRFNHPVGSASEVPSIAGHADVDLNTGGACGGFAARRVRSTCCAPGAGVDRSQGTSSLWGTAGGFGVLFGEQSEKLGLRGDGTCPREEQGTHSLGSNPRRVCRGEAHSLGAKVHGLAGVVGAAPEVRRGRRASRPHAGNVAVVAEPGLRIDGGSDTDRSSGPASSGSPTTVFAADADVGRGDGSVPSSGVHCVSRQCAGDVLGRDETSPESLSWLLVERVSSIPGEHVVYDVTVAEDHNFFAGGVLVHNCPPALQPPVLNLVLETTIGFTQLGPRVRILAAANPPEYAANGYDLNPAQANRIGHIEWAAPTSAEHKAYMLRGTTSHGGDVEAQFSAEEEEARVLAAWDGGAWARAVGLETAFLSAREDLKNVCPKAADPNASRAWPSDRSWENATRALASAQVHGLTEAETDEFVSAFIGIAAYKEFKTFIKAADLPDTAKLLDGQITFQHNPARLDKTMAVINACLALVSPAAAPHREDRAVNFWKMLCDLFEGGCAQDLVISPAQALTVAGLGGNSQNVKLKTAYIKLGAKPKWADLLKLAGFGVGR